MNGKQPAPRGPETRWTLGDFWTVDTDVIDAENEDLKAEQRNSTQGTARLQDRRGLG